MPTKPQPNCSEPLCPNVGTVKGRCIDHARTVDRSIKSRTEYRWVYSSPRWRGLRRQVFKEQRGRCAVLGCMSLGTDLDHIVPLRDDGMPFDRANVQLMCKLHHSAKTRQEVFGFKASKGDNQ